MDSRFRAEALTLGRHPGQAKRRSGVHAGCENRWIPALRFAAAGMTTFAMRQQKLLDAAGGIRFKIRMNRTHDGLIIECWTNVAQHFAGGRDLPVQIKRTLSTSSDAAFIDLRPSRA